MLIGVFGVPGAPIIDACTEGLSSLCLPFRVRNHQWFDERDGQDISTAFIQSATPGGKAALAHFNQKGIPTFIFDYGYFERAHERNPNGYWGLNRGTWQRYIIKKDDCPSDRFDRLGLTLKPEKKTGDYILIHGQDQAAGTEWAQDAYRKLRMQGFKEPIYFRPHPRWNTMINCEGKQSGPIQWNRVLFSVVRSSNMGNLSLLEGVPIWCDYPPATYKSLAMSGSVEIKGDRQDYFNRLAYSQWHIEEIASGVALEQYLEGEI